MFTQQALALFWMIQIPEYKNREFSSLEKNITIEIIELLSVKGKAGQVGSAYM